jgi:hypothetical protein
MIDKISSGSVIPTDDILILPTIAKDNLKVLLSYVPTDTPAERADVVVKGVMNRSQDTLNFCGLHRYDTMLSLCLCHTSPKKTPVT